jgi:hypothetical protein
MIEYTLDIDLPDRVFEHPTIIGMSQAACDVLSWPNVRSLYIKSWIIELIVLPQDLISFNVSIFYGSNFKACSPPHMHTLQKEQANGDYQNLVCVIMRERGLELQGAVDVLTSMLADRVQDYALLKRTLPSFGSEIDRELGRYLVELEHAVHGTIRWYYDCRSKPNHPAKARM